MQAPPPRYLIRLLIGFPLLVPIVWCIPHQSTVHIHKLEVRKEGEKRGRERGREGEKERGECDEGGKGRKREQKKKVEEGREEGGRERGDKLKGRKRLQSHTAQIIM